MKKFYSYVVLLFWSLNAFSQAPIVHGTVVNQSSVAVAGQVIHLTDSSNGVQLYVATDTTNANGEYSFTIPGNVPTGSGMHLRTEKCGMVYSNSFAYQGTNAISNFIVCGTTNNNISGTVKLGSATGNPAYPATVFLIHKTLDPNTNAYVLTLIDTTATNTNGEFQFTGITYSAGDLLVKSALISSNVNYASYLPTYKENALTWNVAQQVTFTAGANNIHLIAGINPGGPGFIGGSVLQGANKTTNVGDPLSNKLILLTTINDVGIGYTYSDANGAFTFSNLPYGTYKLFGDAWGKSNAIDTITLSATNPSIQVVFSENSIQNIPTAIGNEPLAKKLNIYPNPFSDFLIVTGINELNGRFRLRLYNNLGICCLSQIIDKNESLLQIPTKQLSNGQYLLQILNEHGELIKTAKMIKE